MKNGMGIKLTSYDDLLSGENCERVQEIKLTELHSFKNHPFKVKDDERMQETVESIQKYGVLVPALARQRMDGGYEILAGHRRHRASELAGKETMPVLVRNLDDDEAVVVMVDSNLQRENLLPSEKAWAYKMKLDALNHQGATCGQVGHKSRDAVAENAPDSGRQIQRYIRLTELLPYFLQMVDDKKLPFNVAVEVSYLTTAEQEMLFAAVVRLEIVPSLVQAARLKKYSQEEKLSEDVIDVILSEERPEPTQVTLKNDRLQKYFPKNYSSQQMEEVILNLLEKWSAQHVV